MSDQERLEGIKIKINTSVKEDYFINLTEDEGRFLLKQAEEKQELEEKVKEYHESIKSWANGKIKLEKKNESVFKMYLEEETKNEVLMIKNDRLEQQNKRYEEALQFYENEDNYEFAPIVTDCDIEIESEIFDDGGDKARKALKNK